MKIIVQGIGAIGGTIAAALSFSGQEVVGIARGQQLDAINSSGLTFRTPNGTRIARFPCVAHPGEADIDTDDIVVIAVKSQDTHAALIQLRDAGVHRQHIFCAQNGVENERSALRFFPNVHGITVMLPAEYTSPGEVVAFGAPKHGIFDIGRYPSGSDEMDAAIALQFEAASIAAFVVPEVMKSKYGKLIMNLRNLALAAFGPSEITEDLTERLRAEARSVLAAAGASWEDVGLSDPRRQVLMKPHAVEGFRRGSTSSSQSLIRQTGSIETDFLNGEIVLLGRLHGIATPLNDWAMQLAARLVREGLPPGSLESSEIKQTLDALSDGRAQ